MPEVIRVLDLFCGAGGSSVGIERAFDEFPIQGKIEITGIDILDQPDYRFYFKKQDALSLLSGLIGLFDFIWASPPCQAFTWSAAQWDIPKADLIPATRSLLLRAGKPFVLENVPTAPLKKDLMLCGTMFGLKLIRHRHFEIEGFACKQPEHKPHEGSVKDGDFITCVGHGCAGSNKLKDWQEAMGITWTKNKHSIAQAMPPVYSKYIFTEFLKCQK